MLEELRVRNYALIDEVTVNFRPGLNVLSGETGAGKSILIDALSLALGGKGRADGVREGAAEAEVVALFRCVESPELREWCKKYGIQPEDETLIIRRTLRPNGRGSVSVQTVPTTRAALGELAAILVDIHGQHEHQSLFHIPIHRKLLDSFAGLEDRVSRFQADFNRLAELNRKLDALDRDATEMDREADFLQRSLEEIDSANLINGEEEQLAQQQKVLAMHEELTRNLEMFLDAAAESRNGALCKLRKANDALAGAVEIDASLTAITRRLESAFFEIEDIVEEVRRHRNSAESDPSKLEAIDDRLARINTLQKKYGSASIAGVLAYAEEARTRLMSFNNREDERRTLDKDRSRIRECLTADAASLGQERHRASGNLQKRTEEHLKALGMSGARFVVDLKGKKNAEGRSIIGPYGSDAVEFLLSANKGEHAKPLKSVASGGELSRVMLALKSVLSESDPVPTMVFDEVDTGIGGEVARSVGEHLYGLSANKQVFCITHLASIAVFADNHLQIEKTQFGDRTVVQVNLLHGDARVREIARMLAGISEDSISLDHAARLLQERGWNFQED